MLITPSNVKLTDDMEKTIEGFRKALIDFPYLKEIYKNGLYWIKNGKKEKI